MEPDEGSRRMALAGDNPIKVKLSEHLSQSLESRA